MIVNLHPELFYPALLYVAVLTVTCWWRLRGRACLLCGREFGKDEDVAQVCKSHHGPLL